MTLTLSEHSFDEYDMKLSEWRGYVVRALEDINKEQALTNQKIDALDCKIDKFNHRVTNIEIKVAGVSGLTGFIVTLITLIITGAIAI